MDGLEDGGHEETTCCVPQTQLGPEDVLWNHCCCNFSEPALAQSQWLFQTKEAVVGSEVDFSHVSSPKLKLLITVCGPKEVVFQICGMDPRNFMT